MSNKIKELLEYINGHHGINDKAQLCKLVTDKYSLTKDRSVYYCNEFAIRYSSSNNQSFSNTVLSLSNLQKVDDRPFLVCLVTPNYNYIFLVNTTFLKKISHSSQELRENNIRGQLKVVRL